MKYPNQIKEIRIRKNLSQTDLASKIGMDRSFLSHIELGNRKVPDQFVEKLCIVLDVGLDQLFGSSTVERIDEVVLKYAIEIVSASIDASDLTENQRVNLVKNAYKMVKEVFERKLTNEQLEEEVNKMKQELDKEVSEIQEQKKNIFNFFKKSSN